MYYTPKLFVSLVSVQRLAKLDEYRIIFDDIEVYYVHTADGVYYLPLTP